MTAPATVALGQPGSGVLAGFLILATSIWVGGLGAIFIAARVARRTLETRQRVAFFRGLGRVYGPVGGIALVVALGCAAGLLGVEGHAWDGTLVAATVVAICLVSVTAAGMVQARRMTRIRRAAVRQPGDVRLAARVRRGAVRAAVLRAAIAALSLALIALGVLLAP